MFDNAGTNGIWRETDERCARNLEERHLLSLLVYRPFSTTEIQS